MLRQLLITSIAVSAAAEPVYWNQFRGPNGSGTAPGFEPPVKFSPDKPAWKAAVPGAHSSPVVWESRLYLTGMENGRLTTLSLEAATGKMRWKRQLSEMPLARVHKASSPAASTPCVDADGIYVYFGSYGLVCYAHDGEEKWRRRIPTPKSMYGMSTSPIVNRDLLYLVLDNDANLPKSRLSQSKVIAVNKKTGRSNWETQRPYNRSGWSTPVLWKQKGETILVVFGNGRAYGYDAWTGTEEWYVNGFSRETIATPVIGDGRIYLSASRQGGWGEEKVDPLPFWEAVKPFDKNGDGRVGRDEITKNFTIPFRPELPIGHPGFGMPLPKDPKQRLKRQHGLFGWRDKNRDGFWTKEEFISDMMVGRGRPNLTAVRPGGRGDITESHVDWNLRTGIPEIPSPLYYQGRIYLVRAGGVLSSVDTEDGKVLYRERLDAPGQYSPSPIAANGHIYLVSSRGKISIVKAGDEFQVVNQINLKQAVPATPAMDEDTLYIRTSDHILAFR
ncbi:MAG: PQQ-binding-like beta-propeller repeat protein [Limisphaerales bacterium]